MSPIVLTLVILFITAVFFVWGKIRSDIVALCSLLSLVLLGILKPNEALAGFSNSVVIMMVGLLLLEELFSNRSCQIHQPPFIEVCRKK